MRNGKKTILIIMGRYLPGYKDGGPVRSIKNLTDYLGEEYHFKILTCDRDHGDKEAYSNIKVKSWNVVGNAAVYYVPPGGFTINTIITLSKEVDLIYICGCFNDYAINTLLVKRLGKIKIPVVIAAMGLFSPKEFHLKYFKKKTFITLLNIAGAFKNIYWSATSEMEISEIKQQVWARNNQFFIAEDLPRIVDNAPIIKNKIAGYLNIVWISRIAPKKNLKGAIKILQKIRGNVSFTIYGPKYDLEYWNECEKELEKLPDNIKWEWRGNVQSEKVVETLKPYHVFLFPTLGENYGHVIQEALSAGCAVILSDQTPWNDLEENNIGYTFPLEEEDQYITAIEKYVDMNQEQIQEIANSALQYAIKNSNEKIKSTGYRKIFDIS